MTTDEVIAQAEALVAKLKNTPPASGTPNGVERVLAARESGTAGPVNDPGAAASASGADPSAGGNSAPPLSPEDRVRMADSVAALLEGTTTDPKLALRLLREDGVKIEAGADKMPHYKKADGSLAPLNAEAVKELLSAYPLLHPPAGHPGSGGRGGIGIPIRRATRDHLAMWQSLSGDEQFRYFKSHRAEILAARRNG